MWVFWKWGWGGRQKRELDHRGRGALGEKEEPEGWTLKDRDAHQRIAVSRALSDLTSPRSQAVHKAPPCPQAHWSLSSPLRSQADMTDDCAYSLQLCPTLGDPMDRSLPGSSVHGILQARIMEWITISYSRGSSRPRDQLHLSYVSCIGR